MECKSFSEDKDWRNSIWKNFDQKTLIDVCKKVHKQHENYFYKSLNAFGIKDSWHSGIDGKERTYSTILAEAFHKNNYEVAAEFESIDHQVAKIQGKKVKKRRICDLSLLKGKTEYVLEVKLAYLGLHREFKDLLKRLKTAKSAIRKQFNKVETEATRIGWVFFKVWEELSKKDARFTNRNIRRAKGIMERLSETSIYQTGALFSWYRPWSTEVLEEYYKTVDGFDNDNKAYYNIGLYIIGFHIQRGGV